jgi:tyrosinase
MHRWTSQPLSVPIRTGWKRADLEFEGVEHDGASFLVHLFFNNTQADASTPRTDDERYAGYLTVFAHGDCWGDVGHCELPTKLGPFDHRPPHPLVPFNATLEVTDALRALPDPADQITVTALAFNQHGDDAGVLRFKQLTLLTYA